ncbi:hypothetical protein HD73_0270 [Bacillus thuringiensis serovar kurstaki str. HD73]|nr:hypothetical protein HD73_0270 [Bacillus thuringiensis serovar kurstaki str. HD73]EEM55388.1 hypothetical protein bthur0006_2450 [Bacillus thuringiensis serovar kurstaki str. T03a001]
MKNEQKALLDPVIVRDLIQNRYLKGRMRDGFTKVARTE